MMMAELNRELEAGALHTPADDEIFQRVSPGPTEFWTDTLAICLEWLVAGDQNRILDIDAKLLDRRIRRKEPNE
jgi:hypothetical protein